MKEPHRKGRIESFGNRFFCKYKILSWITWSTGHIFCGHHNKELLEKVSGQSNIVDIKVLEKSVFAGVIRLRRY
jgi:hypothetical protein